MITNEVRNTVLMAAALLMASYLYLNISKATLTVWMFDEIGAGVPVQRVTLMTGNLVLTQQKLAMNGFFAADGRRQLNFIHLADSQWRKVESQPKRAYVIWQRRKFRLQKYGKEPFYHVDLPGRKLYVLNGKDGDSLARILVFENSSAPDVVQCSPDDFCQSLKIVNGGWSTAGGPYNENDISSIRRGLPKGRWLIGPETKISFQAERPMKVAILVNMLGTVPDQKIAFNGPGLKAKSVPVKRGMIEVGGKQLFPKAAILELDLQQGLNELVIRFSKWGIPDEQRKLPYAAWLTDMKIKEVKS